MKPYFSTKFPLNPNTPLGSFHSIVDTGGVLTFNFMNGVDDNVTSLVKFNQYLAYRVADEGMLLAYWDGSGAGVKSHLWELAESEFSTWLDNVSCGVAVCVGNYRHYLVETDTTCMEVLAMEPPEFVSLTPPT